MKVGGCAIASKSNSDLKGYRSFTPGFRTNFNQGVVRRRDTFGEKQPKFPDDSVLSRHQQPKGLPFPQVWTTC